MKEINYVPSDAKGENAKFEGSIKLKMPTFDDRFRVMEEAQFRVGLDKSYESNVDQIPAIRRAVALSKEFYLEGTSLKKKEDGAEFKSFDDMNYDPDCAAVLIDVAMQIMSGFKISKN